VILVSYTVNPIGFVRKDESSNYLEILPKYWEATTHLDLFSHAIVLWWIDGMDTPETRSTVLANPPRNKGPIPSGIFSCRSPARPNPIGHTILKILGLEPADNRIRIDHMDANDGSPILDIKPYLPSSDRVENAKVASWFENLEVRYPE
jgi:tRNA-Thr(GGU) m(6)t(6)A37 methyltransferase TsaA